MTSESDSPPPLIDSPVEGLLEWDSPFRQKFVAGSDWAPWLSSADVPPHDGKPRVLASPTVRAPEPPQRGTGPDAHGAYRREYESRLDEAYAEWKRSVFVSLFEPWIIDRLAADAARKLGKKAQDAPAPDPGQTQQPGRGPSG
jgi:hypothetical protein